MAELFPTLLCHPYRLVSKIGAGGMGGVYLGADTKLEREGELKTRLLFSSEK